MKYTLTALTVAATLSLALSAHADESAQVKTNVEEKSNGGYEATTVSEKTNPDGTKIKSEKKVDLDVDSNGKGSKTIKKQTSTSHGLMHKKKDSETTEFKDKNNGGYKETTTREHQNTDGTSVSSKSTTDVDVDSNGNATTVAKTQKTVDPEGLMNATTTKSMTKSVNGKVIEENVKTQ